MKLKWGKKEHNKHFLIGLHGKSVSVVFGEQ